MPAYTKDDADPDKLYALAGQAVQAVFTAHRPIPPYHLTNTIKDPPDAGYGLDQDSYAPIMDDIGVYFAKSGYPLPLGYADVQATLGDDLGTLVFYLFKALMAFVAANLQAPAMNNA